MSRHRKSKGIALGVLAAIFLVLPAPAFAGNSVTRWVEFAMQTVRDRNIGTPNAGRLYAMVTAAMYDAVNGIDTARGQGRESAIVAATGAPVNGHLDAAVAAAAHAVLVGLAPAQAAVLDAALDADLSALGATARPVVAGQDWGAYVGQQVLIARANDGTQVARNLPAGSGMGVHRAAFDARFADMHLFGIASAAPYISGPPPPIPSDEYLAAFNDVKTYGRQDGDPARNAIARFWLAENNTVRETGLWMQALVPIVEQQGTVASVRDTARLFALVAMATADAVKVVWATKEYYFTWRPAIAIREADSDSNPFTVADPGWTPRNTSIGGSPEYNSGTSSFGGVASAVIEQFYCNANVGFCFASDNAIDGPRCYATVLEAAEEGGRSRIYQGIHFQFSNDEGRRVGREIGKEVVTTRLRKLGRAAEPEHCKLP